MFKIIFLVSLSNREVSFFRQLFVPTYYIKGLDTVKVRFLKYASSAAARFVIMLFFFSSFFSFERTIIFFAFLLEVKFIDRYENDPISCGQHLLQLQLLVPGGAPFLCLPKKKSPLSIRPMMWSN